MIYANAIETVCPVNQADAYMEREDVDYSMPGAAKEIRLVLLRAGGADFVERNVAPCPRSHANVSKKGNLAFLSV